MTTSLTLTLGRRSDGRPLLAVTGEIDQGNAGSFAEALDRTSGPVVVDLTGVEYLDSAGLSVLFTHSDRLEVIATPLLAPVLTISGLADIAPVHGLDA
jgi:anti-anti-sigma factor